MQNKYKIAIVGSTGLVGRTVLKVLEEKNFTNCTYTLFSSKRSAGTKLKFLGQNYIIQELTENSFDLNFDYTIFCTGSSISEKVAPIAISKKCLIIDNSSLVDKIKHDFNVPYNINLWNSSHVLRNYATSNTVQILEKLILS